MGKACTNCAMFMWTAPKSTAEMRMGHQWALAGNNFSRERSTAPRNTISSATGPRMPMAK